MKKVSIIVPIYNSSKYINKCLDSLVNQTYKDIEIILINDGSTDKSEEIIKPYLKKYKNIVYIKDTNHGQGYARNKGLEVCTGNLITFVDSDDYIDYDMILKLVDNLGDSDISICDINKVINSSKVYFKNYYTYGTDKINVMLSHPGPVAKLYRKEIIKNVRFLENVYYEDLAFTTVLSQNVSKVSYLEEALYYYVIHDNSTMQQKKFTTKLDDIFKVMDYVSSNLTDYPTELEYLYIEHYLYSATLRFVDYKEGLERLDIINKEMLKYPNYKNNIYYQKKSIKFKLICNLSMKKKYHIIKLLKKIGDRK